MGPKNRSVQAYLSPPKYKTTQKYMHKNANSFIVLKVWSLSFFKFLQLSPCYRQKNLNFSLWSSQKQKNWFLHVHTICPFNLSPMSSKYQNIWKGEKVLAFAITTGPWWSRFTSVRPPYKSEHLTSLNIQILQNKIIFSATQNFLSWASPWLTDWNHLKWILFPWPLKTSVQP